MSTTENITDPYEYLERQTNWLELPEKVIKNLKLKVSHSTIGDSFVMAVRVYEGVCNGTKIIVARCAPDGWRDKTDHALIVIEGYGWFRASLEMLEDEPFIIEYIKQSIDRSKKFNP